MSKDWFRLMQIVVEWPTDIHVDLNSKFDFSRYGEGFQLLYINSNIITVMLFTNLQDA